LKIYIRCFAEQQKEIERMLSEKTDNIIDLMLCIIMSPNRSTVNHWTNEIFSLIPRIDILKGKNSYPSAKKIYNWTYGKKRDTVVGRLPTMKVRIRNAISQEHFSGSYDPEILMNQLDYVCYNYFLWLSKELSEVGMVACDDVRDVIAQIVDEL
jgi:hypothetical protein